MSHDYSQDYYEMINKQTLYAWVAACRRKTEANWVVDRNLTGAEAMEIFARIISHEVHQELTMLKTRRVR